MSAQTPFQSALACLNSGDVDELQRLLQQHPGLADERDETHATLLIRLIDWPGHRPRAAESAKSLLEAGADVDARRNAENGTPLSGALCTEEVDVIRILLEHGADIHAPCGWQPGTVLDLARGICENQDRVDDENTAEIAEIFTNATGRRIP